MKTAKEIRSQFLSFFQSKQHKIVPSAPIVVKDDPTLMFTNAGMNQFKDFFLGNKEAKQTRVTDTQKCLRVSGKHNDLEEVGVDHYHHTMFEMLGNWSFGDYFKEEAIEWAWELLTEVYQIDKDRLYVTVFEGDEADNIPFDQDAHNFWKKHISEERILKGNKKDNFWEMGDVGPCGPCSEIHYDGRSNEERQKVDGKTLVNQDHEQVIEIWNNVFIEFERKADGKLVKLPNQHVDTGMGFERLVRVLQNKQSNYDTDIFQPLIQEIAKLSNIKYGEDNKKDIAFRVIADHVRAISFTIADGQLPASNGAGYVIRRILRRAVRYGYTFLGFQEAFIYQLIPELVNQFGEVFPEIKQQEAFITKVIQEEESSFFKTLSTGLKLMDEIQADKSIQQSKIIPGEKAFELYDTYGFPIDLTQLIAQENGFTINLKAYEKARKEQQNRSRNAESVEQSDWIIINDTLDTSFIGYAKLEAPIQISKYRKIEKKGKTLYQFVFDQTPFYAESGGQVGDKGTISYQDEIIPIVDTQKENDLIIHISPKLPSETNVVFAAKVNGEKRNLTAKNHSATHLLHEALRDHLGTHVEQRGSLVNENYLRFDFSHFQKVSEEELKSIENAVNLKINENIPLQIHADIAIEKAKEMGAMALFGEKYGDKVRVIQFGSSIELCGGTHVEKTGDIKLFKIMSESSIASGIRRIEAWTDQRVIEYYQEQTELLDQIKKVLKQSPKPLESIEKLQEENASLKKKLQELEVIQQNILKKELLNLIDEKDGVACIFHKVQVDNADILKNLSFQLKNEIPNLFLVLAADINGKPLINVAISDDIVAKKELNAGQIVRNLAKAIQGGGGGQAFFATAGGKNLAGLDEVLTLANEIKWS